MVTKKGLSFLLCGFFLMTSFGLVKAFYVDLKKANKKIIELKKERTLNLIQIKKDKEKIKKR